MCGVVISSALFCFRKHLILSLDVSLSGVSIRHFQLSVCSGSRGGRLIKLFVAQRLHELEQIEQHVRVWHLLEAAHRKPAHEWGGALLLEGDEFEQTLRLDGRPCEQQVDGLRLLIRVVPLGRLAELGECEL